jgi:hypothetical protein
MSLSVDDPLRLALGRGADVQLKPRRLHRHERIDPQKVELKPARGARKRPLRKQFTELALLVARERARREGDRVHVAPLRRKIAQHERAVQVDADKVGA